MRIKLSVIAVLLCGVASGQESFEKAVAPFLKEHCVRCHGEEKQKGDFRIDKLSTDFVAGEDAELWFEVITRMGAGEMPPDDEPVLPSAEESQQIMDWLSEQIIAGEAARAAKRPAVAHYRLSREEYSNTIYDLLGVKYDTRAPGAFSEDPEWHGFERIGSELSLAPSHVEKYLAAARTILDQAFPDKEPFQVKSHRDALAIDWNNAAKRKELEEIGVADHVRVLLWPGHQLSYLRPDGGHRHASGTYRAKIKLSGLAPEGGRPPHLELYSKKLDRVIFEADILAPEEEPVVLEFETFIPEGQVDISIKNAVPGPSNSGRAGRPGGFVFTTLDDPKSRAPWQRKMTDDEGMPLYPFLIFDSIEWEGPIVKPADLAKREGLIPREGADEATIGDHLKRFAVRAWRRPVMDVELDRYTGVVTDQLAGGVDFRTSFKAGMTAILASKNFTYIAEGDPDQRRREVSDVELASRLSYFLWSSLPDSELMDLAQSGALRKPEVLRGQFRRMIADPKIERFCDSFPRQWLQLNKVGMFPPDEKLYPDYDKWLEKSMILETTGYFAEVFENNLPIREFVDSNWTVLNPRLSLHYEVPVPKQAGFRRVALRPEDHRGGILTHASVLSLTSDGTRHRPVHRGVWVSEAIFGKVPPPPPPNVDAIEPNPIDAPKATIRMKLEAHKANENCAACHARIDPLGLAFDNFDAVGRWRTEEIVPKGTGKNPAVDASGELPDGRKFADSVEFKQLVAEDEDAFARALTEKLANYGLRRAMTVDDAAELDRIVAASKKNGHRFRDLVEAFANSELFLKR